MKKAELMNLLGERVRVTYSNGKTEEGILRYADDFSSKHGYRKPDYFYLSESSMIFKVSHLKKCERK